MAYAPKKDAVIEGNPLFVGQGTSGSNPLFYGAPPTEATGMQSAYPTMGTAAYPTGSAGTMQGTSYTANAGLSYGGGGGSVNNPYGAPTNYAGQNPYGQ